MLHKPKLLNVLTIEVIPVIKKKKKKTLLFFIYASDEDLPFGSLELGNKELKGYKLNQTE